MLKQNRIPLERSDIAYIQYCIEKESNSENIADYGYKKEAYS